MNAKLVRIGNSRGVRIPKPLIEEACLSENVALRVVNAGILIERMATPRTGWGEAAKALAEERDGDPSGERPLDPVGTTDWTWK